MSVFIKGMKKPKNCFGCDFNMYDCYCKINHGGIDRDFWLCDKSCPIIEIPISHGGLVDINDVIDAIDTRLQVLRTHKVFIRKHGDIDLLGVMPYIAKIQPVIEAEEQEE